MSAEPHIGPLTQAEDRLERRSNGAPSNRVHLRDTHPNLYLSLMLVATAYVWLGLNFLFTTPTFEQFNIPKNYIGVGFLSIGLAFLLFLNVRRNLKAVRMLLIAGIVYSVIWGFGTLETFFAGDSSAQLGILYWAFAGLQWPLLREPFFNPVTSNGRTEDE